MSREPLGYISRILPAPSAEQLARVAAAAGALHAVGGGPTSPVRRCRICGCTDARACPGGCAWALEDVCTACVGHTPASWAAFRHDPLGYDARPPMVSLISAIAHASSATHLIGELVADLAPHRTPDVCELALVDFVRAALDLLDARAGEPRHAPLRQALDAFLDHQPEEEPYATGSLQRPPPPRGGMRSISASNLAAPGAPFEPGPAPMLQWVRVEDLVVDDAYQRPIRGAGVRNVSAIAEGFRWANFAPLIVSPVPGGRFALIDGQHRATAAALRGQAELPAMVVIAGRDAQAAAFRAVNGQTTRLGSLELHRAALAAGDEEANRIERVCRSAGVTVSPHPRGLSRLKPGETLAIGTLRAQLRVAGPALLGLALRCVTETPNNRPGVLSALVIDGLCAQLGRERWESEGELLIEACRSIVLDREADKARFTPRERGQPAWLPLRDRLNDRFAEVLPRLRRQAA